MEKTTVDLRALSSSQKTEFLEHVRTFLRQRVEEEKYYRSFSMSSLEKDNVELNSNSTSIVQQGMSNLINSIEKLRNLRAEEKNLLLEIEELKKMAEARVSDLERKVNPLRDEVTSLKSLIYDSEPSANEEKDEAYKRDCFSTQ